MRHIERGVPEGLAAKAVGLDPETLRTWRREDGSVLELMQAALARAVARKVERIDEAGQRGDWKADSWYLERSRETRGDFGQAAVGEKSEINFIINVPRAGQGWTGPSIIAMAGGESRPHFEGGAKLIEATAQAT